MSKMSEKTDFVNFDNLRDGDVDDGFSDARNIEILVDVKHRFRLVNVTHRRTELPTAARRTQTCTGWHINTCNIQALQLFKRGSSYQTALDF